MNHQEKQEIFNTFTKTKDLEAIRLGYEPIEAEDWDDVLLAFRNSMISLPSIKGLIFAACDQVQLEQQKRIAENVELSINDDYAGEFIEINKSSILNPENLIK